MTDSPNGVRARGGDRWVRYGRGAATGSGLRLFCFPYAGGGAAAFESWTRGPEPGVDVAAVELPGRGDRFGERPCPDIRLLTEDLLAALSPHLDRPYGFYGHSMGADLAYALAARIARTPGIRRPLGLFVAARRAPRSRGPSAARLSDGALVQWLRGLGGTPEEVLADPDLLAALLPTLRADLELAAAPSARPRDRLAVPVRAFAGRDDEEAPPELMRAWAAETGAGFELTVVPGGHFFLPVSGREVLSGIAADLRRLSAAEAGCARLEDAGVGVGS